jgi:hypothetical protein
MWLYANSCPLKSISKGQITAFFRFPQSVCLSGCLMNRNTATQVLTSLRFLSGMRSYPCGLSKQEKNWQKT